MDMTQIDDMEKAITTLDNLLHRIDWKVSELVFQNSSRNKLYTAVPTGLVDSEIKSALNKLLLILISEKLFKLYEVHRCNYIKTEDKKPKNNRYIVKVINGKVKRVLKKRKNNKSKGL